MHVIVVGCGRVGAAVVVVHVGAGVRLDAQVAPSRPERGEDGGEHRVRSGLVVP